MNAADFRALALALPEAVESAHQGHPDFRVRNKIFATLGPDESWAMVKLGPDTQAEALELAADAFEPIPGAWGKQGCTRVTLKKARKRDVTWALGVAWRRTAPKTLVREHDEG